MVAMDKLPPPAPCYAVRIAPNAGPQGGPATERWPARKNVALFRSLFRVRDEVYTERWENNRTGKSGYAPACGNE